MRGLQHDGGRGGAHRRPAICRWSKRRPWLLGGTGPVGQRVARLLAGAGRRFRVGLARVTARPSSLPQSDGADERIRISTHTTGTGSRVRSALKGVQLVISAGAVGGDNVARRSPPDCSTLQVAIDLNAVSPPGIEGTTRPIKAKPLDGALALRALGVGGLKMKIHKAAIARLFESNDQILDAEEVFSDRAAGWRANRSKCRAGKAPAYRSPSPSFLAGLHRRRLDLRVSCACASGRGAGPLARRESLELLRGPCPRPFFRSRR